MKQSIIIPFHKDKDMLLYSLKTLYETLPSNQDIEIIVVGNNQIPSELNFELPWSEVKFYKIYENLFYPKAVNYGVSKASGEIITLCDPDIFYLSNWYMPLLNSFIDKKAGAVSSKLINPCTGRILDFGVYYSKYNAIHSLMGAKADHPLAKYNRQVQSACSAVLMTSKKLYETVGGMDIDLPFAYPDFDFCLKLHTKGYPIWVIADSVVYHKGSTDSNNSKYYSFSYLKTDCKGLFYAKDYDIIRMDFGDWFKESYEYFRKLHPQYPSKYMLLDLTTMYNREDYYSVMQKKLNLIFLDKEVISLKRRNAPEIPLHQTVSFNLIDCNSPILYFTDTFTSLFHNDLWFKMRDIKNDIVIDRHGNILPCTEIAQGNC